MTLTLAGGLYIALTLLLGFAAVNTGNNLLYLLVSALLGFMAVSGLLGQQNLRRLQLRVVPGGEFYADSPAPAAIELSNRRRWLPAFLIQVEVAGTEVVFPVLAAGEKQRQGLTLTLPERGLQRVPPMRLSSRFPVNFFIRYQNLASADEFLVFPRPIPAEMPGGAGEARRSRPYSQGQPGSDGELRQIDSYRPGDPVKAIHWKLSARHQDLKVKRLGQSGAPTVIVNFSAMPGDFEERLGRCTYLIDHLLRRQHAVGLALPARRYPPAHGTAHRASLLRALALYDQR